MNEEILEMLEKIKGQGRILLEMCGNENLGTETPASRAVGIAPLIDMMEEIVPAFLYKQYKEFFSAFSVFCKQCGNQDFLLANKEEMISSLELFDECMDDLQNHLMQTKKCPCCGSEVLYVPLADYYSEMQKRFHAPGDGRAETLNKVEYSCPDCGASDRDRLIISFLKKEGLREAAEGTRVLQIAPAASISGWIMRQCPHIKYETTDLFMDQVTFRSDIMNMETVCDETYDVIICSHVLEHVRDDRKALSEMKRILKPDGKIVFLVPINLNASAIDEEWGLPEDENWRRFGQGDHCRAYDKQGLLQRLREQFFVHSLGKEYFGEEIFAQCALTDTSTLYILTKSQEISLSMAEEVVIDRRLCEEGPLVSVVLPCYNHEKFVADAIESVINQSYKNIEIIVSDDGSTDNTAVIMKRYSSYFAKEIYLTENTGGEIGYHLKEFAKGKYIAVMSSDDIWDKDKLALQVAYMEQHEECGACLSWCHFVDGQLTEEYENSLFIQPNRTSWEWMLYFWKYGNALCNPSSIKKREVDLARRPTSFRQLPDLFSWIDIIQKTSIHVMPKILVKMRWHGEKGNENTSYPTKENQRRHMVEEGIGWYHAMRDMDAEFFKKAFSSEMRNPEVNTEAAVKCEKYFLMLNHKNPMVRTSAFYYLQENFGEIWECMEKEYHYTRNELAKDVVNRGM